jgi:hypothetical protein
VYPTGGGSGGDPEKERVDFYLHIPLELSKRDDEARKYLAKIEKLVSLQGITEAEALDRLRELVFQHRAGHFQVVCRILDGDRTLGIAVVEIEVLFKGSFSDVGLPASHRFSAQLTKQSIKH